ncbi:condensation domain-containing protein [Clostridium estertheticum]|uniref:condensation domain-containing protein n=1 Tax=Clostridium estertheticum TaxID=238834 RepID=UPI001CF463D1|nr:condensation domain-containing protein [Clostridium estertheticum]MCB2354687.1 condensation domain-containing protein [Clostridium estertheticum]WAG40932.1 condensation domain-containing protein [Clostridium estertheticum]
MLGLESIKLNKNKSKITESIEEISIRDMAIIGINVDMPLAKNTSDFWKLLKAGKDCVAKFPSSRQADVEEYLKYIDYWKEDEISYRECAYLNDIDKFDYKFFRMSPREAALTDPNQRLFLENVWKTVEDAGYGGKKLIGSRTGVYIGYGSTFANDYHKMICRVDKDYASISQVGNLAPVIASRISYLMDLKGPSMLIDTACSSSLVAVHVACQAIRNGECDMAIVGSIKINLMPVLFKGQDNKIGIESSVNRTKAFDDSSDGTGGGEGVASILIKPLDSAIRDKDNIYAVIKGSAINQDGNSIGISAPSAVAQEDVIIRAWKDAGVDPTSISYIESHGTGTQLGDPIEIDGIQRAFRRYTNRKQFCALGALKTNVGHLDCASGIAGLIKATLALKYKEIPANIHFQRPNRKIQFVESPIYIQDKLVNWETDEVPRRAGVSSFGISGTNCHVVLEEKSETKDKQESRSGKIQVLTLSAKTKQSLSSLITEYKKRVNEYLDMELSDICYTANTGRGHYTYRLVVLLKDMEDFKAKISQITIAENESFYRDNVYFGYHKAAKEKAKQEDTVEITIEEKEQFDQEAQKILEEYVPDSRQSKADLQRLCELYVKGADIEWEDLYKTEKRQNVSLPVYQFEKTRCWLEIPKNEKLFNKKMSITDIIEKMDVPDYLQLEMNETMEKWMKQLNETACTVDSGRSLEIILSGRPSGNYSNMEKLVANTIGEVLGLKEFRINDNFYELGGDSIFALKVVNGLSEALGMKVQVAELMRALTVEEFARFLKKKDNSQDVGSNLLLHIPRVEDGRRHYALSPAQKRMYIMNQHMGSSTVYNLPTAAVIEGVLDIKRIEDAFREIIMRQELLRTSFEVLEGKPMQVIHEKVQFSIGCSRSNNYGVLKEYDIEDIIRRFVRPFDLKQAPLLRSEIVELSENKFLLLTDMHHIISDGTSNSIFLMEFMDHYENRELPELRIQYKDYSEWLDSLFKAGVMKKQERFWINRFKGEIPVLNLPTDYQRQPLKDSKGNSIVFDIDEKLTGLLNRLVRESGASLYMVLLSAYNVLLYKCTGQEDIVIGCGTSGRMHEDLDNIIGMFVNTLAMRNYPSKNKTFSGFLDEVKESTLEAFENQEYPMEELVSRLGLRRDPGRNPLFDTAFVMQNIGMPEFEIKGLKISPCVFKTENSIYDLFLMAFEIDNGIRFLLEYSTTLFSKKTIQNIAKHFNEILTQVTQNKSIPLEEIELSSEFIVSPVTEADSGDFDF